MLWIDLTDLLSWEGNFTGIQRTVYEYAISYMGKAKYFYYDEINDIFCEIGDEILTQYMEAGMSASVTNLNTLNAYKKSIKKIIPKYILESIPLEQKIKIKKYAKKNAQRVLSIKIKATRGDRVSINDIKFNGQDIILIFGAGWHKEGLMDKLGRVKFQNNEVVIISLIYDLIPIYFPQLFGPGMYENYSKYMVRVISLSNTLIGISKSTKRDIIKFCSETGLNIPEVKVIRLGENITKMKSEKTSGKDPDKDFIISVGTIEARKNHQCIYQAYKYAISSSLQMPKIIIVGRVGWLTKDLVYQVTNDPMVKDLIIIRDDISDNELEYLYGKCLFTVYPSLYEGWGLPIAEALSRGKVCIASNTSSMIEISYDLVEHFSPYDPIDLAKKISKLYTNDNLLKSKENKIIKTYKPTTWEESAKSLHNIIDNINT